LNKFDAYDKLVIDLRIYKRLKYSKQIIYLRMLEEKKSILKFMRWNFASMLKKS